MSRELCALLWELYQAEAGSKAHAECEPWYDTRLNNAQWQSSP